MTAVFNCRGNGEIIELLRSHGADPFAQNAHGVSPVELARKIDNHDVRQFFADLDGPAPQAATEAKPAKAQLAKPKSAKPKSAKTKLAKTKLAKTKSAKAKKPAKKKRD